ncbi:MAG: hypothetical protein ABJ275_08095 [Maricaulaceae bacterium]
METEEQIIKNLKSNVRKEGNYAPLIESYSQQIIDFEKRVFVAPLVGNGGGLVLIASGLINSEYNEEIVFFTLISLWSFFFGILVVFLSGMIFIKSLYNWKESYTCKRNSQDEFLSIRDNFHKNLRDNGCNNTANVSNKIINEQYSKQYPSIISNFSKYKRLLEKGNRLVKWGRFFSYLSCLFFIIGVFVPLLLLTIKMVLM